MMGIQADIVSALAAVAGGRVYPQAAPQDASRPFVIYRRLAEDPVTLLDGTVVKTRSSFAFYCFGDTLSDAVSTAGAVVSAVNAAGPSLVSMREQSDGDDYEPDIDAYMEQVQFGFWH